MDCWDSRHELFESLFPAIWKRIQDSCAHPPVELKRFIHSKSEQDRSELLSACNQPEIVYVYNQEYWVTPTTFNYPDPNDWVAVHLVYTHTSRIIVMNSHTGEFVNATEAFHLKSQPLIYYGEDLPNYPGFANDVYVHVKNAPSEIENVSYSGQPDYSLCGAQR